MSDPSAEKSPAADTLREWGFDVKTFEARAKKSLEGTRGDLTEINGVLRQTLSRTKQVLVDLQRQKGPAASELKKGFEEAWEAIERGFARARQKARQQDPTEPVKPPRP